MFELHERILDKNGFKGTIQYIGLLPLENDTKIWYGIEWDDNTRGKHDGSVKDKDNNIVSIFKCADGKGSFVRENKIIKGISIEEAILERYEHVSENDTINTQNTTQNDIETTFHYKDIKDLQSVSLESNKISSIRGDLHSLCPHLKEINISDNLVYKTSFILSLLKECPHLERLYMSRNSLFIDDISSMSFSMISNQLQILSLGYCCIHLSSLKSLSSYLISLKSLYLHSNPLGDMQTIDILEQFTNLSLLDLSDCRLSNWTTFQCLSCLPNLTNLSIAENSLSDINENSTECHSFSTSVQCIDLNDTLISSIKTLSTLFNYFPSLISIICLKTPLYKMYEDSLLIREEIIASFEHLHVLNNTTISSKEREESELYYLKQWLLKSMETAGCANITEWNTLSESRRDELLSLYPRYKSLCKIYGEPIIKENTRTIQNTLLTNSITITLKSMTLNKTITKKFQIHTTIKQLKQVICKLFKLEPLKTVFYYSHMNSFEVLNCETDTLLDYQLKDGDTLLVEENDEIDYHI